MVVGSFRVAWHSVFALIGMLAGGFVSIRCARYLVRDERVYPFAIAVVIGGLVGARVAHVTDNSALYAADPLQALQFWGGGIGTMGAPIGSTIAGYLAARWLRLPIGFMFDVSVIGIALGEAIGRIGDIINGEHHSIPCAGLPWCVRYTHPDTLGQSTAVHPIGLYDGLLMLGIFVALFLYWRRVRGQPPESRVWLSYLLLLGGGRFLLSFLRTDPIFLAGLQQAQVLGLLYLGAGAVTLPLLARRAGRRARGPRAQNGEKPLLKPVSDR
ncbi:MAG TPA: prolipoprotein diacylglyceryl transferase family protein [Candidatus Limnocylindria bacterium]|nr:prolipoprotein diacylglyceryl transferase family protein [Candidatus Limnocylindria bacterium]